MKSLRERFEDEYAAVSIPADNKNGFAIKYVYYAPWYIWNLPKKQLQAKKQLIVSMSVGSLVLYLAAGLQYIGVNSSPAVTVSALLALCAHVLELVSVFQFLFAGYKTTRMNYLHVDHVLRIAPVFRGCALLVTAVCGIAYMIRNTGDIVTICVILGYAISAGMAIYIFEEYKRIPFTTERNMNLQNMEYVQRN